MGKERIKLPVRSYDLWLMKLSESLPLCFPVSVSQLCVQAYTHTHTHTLSHWRWHIGVVSSAGCWLAQRNTTEIPDRVKGDRPFSDGDNKKWFACFIVIHKWRRPVFNFSFLSYFRFERFSTEFCSNGICVHVFSDYKPCVPQKGKD